jgi:hypothetical protein
MRGITARRYCSSLASREAVVDRRAAQPVAVGHLDQRHAGGIQCGGDRDHLLDRDLVLLGVHAIAQAVVVQHDAAAAQVHEGLPGKAPSAISCAISSPVRSAAAVMMSRLPAYFGR